VPFGYPSTSLRASAQGPGRRTAGQAQHQIFWLVGFRCGSTQPTIIYNYYRYNSVTNNFSPVAR